MIYVSDDTINDPWPSKPRRGELTDLRDWQERSARTTAYRTKAARYRKRKAQENIAAIKQCMAMAAE
jgi:hypothetical protein